MSKLFYYNEYKKKSDFVASPFRYPGGKFYALKHIMPFIECVPHTEYREPFVGGGCVFFAKAKANINWINDLDDKIINVYSTIKNTTQCQLLIDMVVREKATRERHQEVKKLETQNPLEEAFKTYYLNRTSYCGIINKPAWGYAEGKSSPPANWGKFLKCAGAKMAGVITTSLDFEQVISAPPYASSVHDVFMYLDPPYYHADQKRAYTCSFQKNDHDRLANCLKKTPYKFCVSYDDCMEIRGLYSWAKCYNVSWLYCTDNKPGKSRNVGNELIITNYEVKPATLFPLP